MKIIVDKNIPYASVLFSKLGDVKAIPGNLIHTVELNGVDALMVRSTTKVTKSLLDGKSITFIGTATAGTDHIDDIWLKQTGIGFSAAPGCNAVSVVEYVFSGLLALAERDGFILKNMTVGIVGVGNIGKCLKKRLDTLGIRTLLCDPPRADRKDSEYFYTLDDIVEQVDVLTFHTPLLNSGPYKTFHLADESLIRRLKPFAILINTSRGPVIDNIALLTRLKAGQKLSVILDVWETEPNIDIALLNRIDIGTAHIAGYTLEGKTRGTIQVFEAYSSFIGKPQQLALDTLLPMSKLEPVVVHGPLSQSILTYLVHLVYNIRNDDIMLRKVATVPGALDILRNNYHERREWSSLKVICDNTKTMMLLQKLGFNANLTQYIDKYNHIY